ncbi:MAG: hypothetical protein K2O39_06125, partial [Clostridiales bacterium]|nr:hypothetical protein [Clostridiales bacterium]
MRFLIRRNTLFWCCRTERFRFVACIFRHGTK